MRNVFIRPEEKPLPARRKGYPFAGAAPAPVLLTVFKTRRIMVEEPVDPIYVRKPNVDFLYGGAPPVVVPKITFLRKSSYTAVEEEFPNLSRFLRFNPLFFALQQLIILGPGPSGGVVGIPSITGGRQRLQVFVAGTNLTNCGTLDPTLLNGIGDGALQLRVTSQTIGRGQATFDLYDATGTSITIQLGQTVLIQENGIRYFAGCVTSLVVELFKGGTFTVYHVTAVDKSGIFDHRVCTTALYLSGTDVADVIRDLFSNPASCNPPLSEEGITLNNVPASLGALSADIVVNKWTVTQVMNALMADIGGIWFIDQTSDLHAQLLANIGSSPFTITTTSEYLLRASMTTSLLDYRTKSYAVSDRAVTPGAGSTGITGTPVTETWTLPQQLANDLGYLHESIVTNFPILKITSLKVNGVSQPFYTGTLYPPINYRHVWWYFPQTPYLIPPSVTNTNPFADPPLTSSDPVDGDVVEISYISPLQNSQVVDTDALAPTFGTCGSGVYEGVTQVKGITSQADLNAIAQAILTKTSAIHKLFSARVNKAGLFVGQKLNVTLPKLDLNGVDLTITSLSGSAEGGDLGYGSRMMWDLEATSGQDLGNYIHYLEQLFQRTQNAPPVPRYEEANFVVGPGGSIAAGLVDSNPYVVKNTGQVFLGYAIANTAPVDQSLTLDIVSDAQGSIFSSGPTPLIIPAGSTALIKITQFTGDPSPFYLYKDDVLRAYATYAVTGANPVNASSVTLGLRISF